MISLSGAGCFRYGITRVLCAARKTFGHSVSGTDYENGKVYDNELTLMACTSLLISA